MNHTRSAVWVGNTFTRMDRNGRTELSNRTRLCGPCIAAPIIRDCLQSFFRKELLIWFIVRVYCELLIWDLLVTVPDLLCLSIAQFVLIFLVAHVQNDV